MKKIVTALTLAAIAASASAQYGAGSPQGANDVPKERSAPTKESRPQGGKDEKPSTPKADPYKGGETAPKPPTTTDTQAPGTQPSK